MNDVAAETKEKPPRERILDNIQGQNPRSYVVDHFALYARPDYIRRFLMRYELFKFVQNVHGSIIECGLRSGVGLLQWFHISKILEPLARMRIIYGFDTFTGFPSVSPLDPKAEVGGQNSGNVYAHLLDCINVQHLFDTMLQPSHPAMFPLVPEHTWKQVIPIAGDFMETGPKFLEAHPELVVSLLYLDFDIYEPTKLALDLFLPRMPKGSVIVFDELNHPSWPGETVAVQEKIGIDSLALRRFPWDITMSYAIL